MGGVNSILTHRTDLRLLRWDGVSPVDSQTERNFRFAIHTVGELIESFVPPVAWGPHGEAHVRPGDTRTGLPPNYAQDAAVQNLGRAVPRSDFPDVPTRDDLKEINFPGPDAFTRAQQNRIVALYQRVIALCDAVAAGRSYDSADMKHGGFFQREVFLAPK